MAFPRFIFIQTILVLLPALLASCSSVSVPEEYVRNNETPRIYPDYVGVTIPSNIASLNFMLPEHEGDNCIARITSGGEEHVYGDKGKIIIPEDDWKTILASGRKDSITVEVFVEKSSAGADGSAAKAIAYRSFTWHVAEPIDRYVAYRLIPPSYTMYEELRLCQRDLTTFDETVFYENKSGGSAPNHCINCHSFQNYDTKRMQFHVREKHGGTVIVDNGAITKRNLKRSYTIGAGVYPSWHPGLNLIAYSTNKTMQHFHSVSTAKVEVQDAISDIILYDVRNDSVHVVSDAPYTLEVFPSWSPDGKYLYYSAAEVADTTKQWIIDNYKSIRYNIYRRTFNAENLTFGSQELVLDAAADSLSALLPRVSPDGRYLLYSMAPYGVFHIWHKESDLFVKNLGTGDTWPLSAANSPLADSYHNWSSNGRWIVFTSRRNDGNYTRLYMAYVDKNGVAHKAFEMPQADPDYELNNLCSYNVPEFIREPVKPTASQFADVVLGK